MSIQTLKIPFPGTFIKQGDTIPKIKFSFDALDAIDLTNAEIKMQLYNGKQKVFDVSTGNGITILNDKEFEVDEVGKDDNKFPAGKFVGDMEITIDGKRQTYYNVEYTVLQEYTV